MKIITICMLIVFCFGCEKSEPATILGDCAYGNKTGSDEGLVISPHAGSGDALQIDDRREGCGTLTLDLKEGNEE